MIGIIIRIFLCRTKNRGLGGFATSKLLKGPSGKAGGPFNVACYSTMSLEMRLHRCVSSGDRVDEE